MVGPRASFLIEAKNEEGSAADGNCRESVKRKRENHKFFQVTIISNCSKEYKKLESEVAEELIISDTQVVYIHRSGKLTSTCLYERKLK